MTRGQVVARFGHVVGAGRSLVTHSNVHILVSIKLLRLKLVLVGLGAAVELGHPGIIPSVKCALAGGERLKRLGGQNGRPMVHRGGMVSLVNGNSRVNNLRGDSLLLNHRLNMLMHMVMRSLAGNDRCNRRRVRAVVRDRGVFVLGSITAEIGLEIRVVAVLESLVLNWDNVVLMLFGPESLSVLAL